MMARSDSLAHGWGHAHVLGFSEEHQSSAPPPVPDPQIALDGAGDATVIFNLGKTSEREFIELSSRARGGPWKRAVAVARTAYCSATQVALDADGEILLAWTHGGVSPETLIWVEALALNRHHRRESSPQVLSSTNRRSYGIDLVANARGDGALLWGLEWGLEGAGGARVEASTRTAGRRFARAVALPPSSKRSYPGGVAIDPAGTATAVSSTNVVQSSTHPRNGRWSMPTAISTPPAEGSVEELALTANPAGDLASAWTTKLPPAPGQQFGSDVVAASLHVGVGRWQPPSLLSPAHSRHAEISIRPSGIALAVWENEHLARIEAAENVP
jgi:hypothetical protein